MHPLPTETSACTGYSYTKLERQKMKFFSKIIPAYLCEKYNLIKLVSFTALFALIFINVFQPFGSSAWVDSPLEYILYSSLIVLIGFVVIAISRMTMYYWHIKLPLTNIRYLIWILFELLFMALFFTMIITNVDPNAEVVQTFKESFSSTTLILLFPYLLCQLYFSWIEKDRLLEERTELQPVDNAAKMIDFYDERNVLRLSVMKSNILYVEAADNYACIYYFKKNGISRFLLRNSLKALEGYLADTEIVRCHRSYMVNLEYVNVIRRQRGGIFLELNVPEVPDIPLSPRYSDKVELWFHNI